jgi:hypothetical protein
MAGLPFSIGPAGAAAVSAAGAIASSAMAAVGMIPATRENANPSCNPLHNILLQLFKTIPYTSFTCCFTFFVLYIYDSIDRVKTVI